MDQHPRMLYRLGGPVELQDGDYDTRVVADEDAEAEARAEGWHETPAAARAAADAAGPAEDAPPTRAELEQMARELGLKVDGRASDRRLAAAIAAAMEARG